MKRFTRVAKAQERLGVGHSKFYEDFIGGGYLRLIKIGPKTSAVLDDELDALIQGIADGSIVVEPMRRTLPPSPHKRADKRQRVTSRRTR
jgi:hypothetical protein